MSLLDLQGLEPQFEHTEEAYASSLSAFHQCTATHSSLSIILC